MLLRDILHPAQSAALGRAGIRTLEEAQALSDDELLAVVGVGQTTIDRVRAGQQLEAVAVPVADETARAAAIKAEAHRFFEIALAAGNPPVPAMVEHCFSAAERFSR